MNKKTISLFGELKEKLKIVDMEENYLEKEVVYMDNALVMAFGTNNKEIANILGTPEFTGEDTISKLDYSDGRKVKVSTEYLKEVLRFLTKCPEFDSVEILVKNDYPICFNMDKIKSRIVIAPRVED